MGYPIFIDGLEGTTGLEISACLSVRDDLELIPVDEAHRKDPAYKKEKYGEAEVVLLCLPDDAARAAVELDADARFLDASTAHRTNPNWVYGLPELNENTRAAIGSARCVANPGCYPTGFLLAARPLIDRGLVRSTEKIQIHAVSGYSGGGKKLIARYESHDTNLQDTRVYGLNLKHKHVPEMQRHAMLEVPPVFLPSVGPFYRGMIVKFAVPNTSAEEIHSAWLEAYEDEPFVRVLPPGGENALVDGFLSAELCNKTNRVDLIVTANEDDALVLAVLDNLGKGAASAAVQNLNLMLNIDQTKGLSAY